jgi:pSer/pThr/pTyr-binding forkhead associated (FHA) protein
MASLINIKGPDKGSCYAIGESAMVIVGRDGKCDIQVLDPRISRQHLQINSDNAGASHTIAEYRTANGTKVNDKAIMERTPLRDGDNIQLGGTTLLYTTDDSINAEEAIQAAKKKTEWNRSTIISR